MASLAVEYEPSSYISVQRALLSCALAHKAAGTKHVAFAWPHPQTHVLPRRPTYSRSSASGAAIVFCVKFIPFH
jgi:hypothetical protein